MSFFSPAAVEVPAITGSDVIRQALAARLFKGALGRIAQDYGCGIAQLENFARNEGDLPAGLKQQLAREFFNCDFDAELDRLRRQPQPEPAPFATVTPPQFERRPLSEVLGPPRVVPKTQPQPQPARPKRAGWAD